MKVGILEELIYNKQANIERETNVLYCNKDNEEQHVDV